MIEAAKSYRPRKSAYRLETVNGIGVYDAGGVETFDASSTRPAPYEDGLGNHRHDHYFAFRDIGQLLKWFSNFNDFVRFHQKNIVLSVYETAHCNARYGGCQMIFKKNAPSTRLKKQYDMVDFCVNCMPRELLKDFMKFLENKKFGSYAKNSARLDLLVKIETKLGVYA